MYEFIERENGLCKFKVTDGDRFRLITLYEHKEIDEKNIDYNPEFTEVFVTLQNRIAYSFENGETYGLAITNNGIDCVWNEWVPRYARFVPDPPKEETIQSLKFAIPKTDGYYSSNSEIEEPELEEPTKKRKRILPKNVFISKYGKVQRLRIK